MSGKQTEEIYSPYREIENFIDEITLKYLQISSDYIILEDENTLVFRNIDFTSVDEIHFCKEDIKITKKAKIGDNLSNFEKSINITINAIYDEAIPNEKESQEIAKVNSINKLIFIDCILNTVQIDRTSSVVNLTLQKSNIKDRLIIEQQNIKSLYFTDSIFYSKVEIKKCTITDCNFESTRFKDFCDFEESIFNTIEFKNTIFEKLLAFQKTKFTENVDFYYVTFKTHSIFKNTIFQKTVNFENTLFEVDGSFYGISSKEDKIEDIIVSNRETARIIKNSFEQQNNIIEANRFYALEMKKREKELEILKNPLEWIVFKLHGISSNHSQSWLFPLFWIMIVSYLYILFSTKFNLIESFLYNLMIKKDLLNEISDLINPFSIMTSKDPITFGLLIFKIIIAYLIYQFIVSVRQNTRRK